MDSNELGFAGPKLRRFLVEEPNAFCENFDAKGKRLCRASSFTIAI
jgi:hypothetical protein